MLTKDQKKEVVKKLREKFKENKLAVFCNFEGLSVEKQRELKKQFKKNKGSLFVVKRRLLQRALTEEKIEVPEIKGSLIVGIGKDEALPAKIIDTFPKEKKEKIDFVGGILKEGEKYIFLSKKEVENIAKLPSREELLAMFVGTIKTLFSNLNFILNENQRKLTYILTNIGMRIA